MNKTFKRGDPRISMGSRSARPGHLRRDSTRQRAADLAMVQLVSVRDIGDHRPVWTWWRPSFIASLLRGGPGQRKTGCLIRGSEGNAGWNRPAGIKLNIWKIEEWIIWAEYFQLVNQQQFRALIIFNFQFLKSSISVMITGWFLHVKKLRWAVKH